MARLLVLIVIAVSALSVTAQSLLSGGRVPKDLKITLERTVCFGTCPDYKLTIDSQGRVLFAGGRFTRVKGSASGTITSSQLKNIVRRFESSAFFSLHDSYRTEPYCGRMMTDMPSENISITVGGRSKSVHHYFGCHGDAVQAELKRLSDLGKYIDTTTRSVRWIKKR